MLFWFWIVWEWAQRAPRQVSELDQTFRSQLGFAKDPVHNYDLLVRRQKERESKRAKGKDETREESSFNGDEESSSSSPSSSPSSLSASEEEVAVENPEREEKAHHRPNAFKVLFHI